jgi:hypothetical protein
MYTTDSAVTGWCDTRGDHDGRFDHRRQLSCRNFVSDSEHTDRLLREARVQDQRTEIRYPNGATNPAAAYVAEYRPA